jgi:hypothetical protein
VGPTPPGTLTKSGAMHARATQMWRVIYLRDGPLGPGFRPRIPLRPSRAASPPDPRPRRLTKDFARRAATAATMRAPER